MDSKDQKKLQLKFDPTSYNSDMKDDLKTLEEGETHESTRPALKNDGSFAAGDYIDPPPDGGFGWICCFCVLIMNFATWGMNNSFGIFLTFYLSHNVFPDGTSTDFALIGGMLICITLAFMPIAAIVLLKFGYKITASLGVLFQLAGYIGSSFATKISHLYISQGLIMAIGFGFIFGANSIVLPSWFLKKRALANGLSHTGMGVGGIVFSLALNAMIERTGDQKWALRVAGILTFLLCLPCVFIIKIRIPKNPDNIMVQPTTRQIISSTFDVKVWKSYPLWLASIWACFSSVGYCVLLFSLSNYAVSIGLTAKQGTIITTVVNAGQAVGRPGIGYFSEKIGRTNVSLLGTGIGSILCYALWINSLTFRSLIAFGLLVGFIVGISSVNVVPLVSDVVGLNGLAAGLSLANILVGILSLLAEVIALHLRDYNLSRPYLHSQIFVGTSYACSTLFLLPYREWKVRRILTQRMNNGDLEEKEEKVLEAGMVNYLKRMFYPMKA